MENAAKQVYELEVAARPLMKWLAENYNPHATVIVTSDRAELVEGKMSFVTDEYIKD